VRRRHRRVARAACASISRVERRLAIHADDADARVQAGVTRKQLNAALRGSGLQFPIDPGGRTRRSVGHGLDACSGTNAVRTARCATTSCRCRCAGDGEVIETGGRARSRCRYDLTRLFVGAKARWSS